MKRYFGGLVYSAIPFHLPQPWKGPRMSCKIRYSYHWGSRVWGPSDCNFNWNTLSNTPCPPTRKNTKTWGRIVGPLQPYLAHPLNFNWNLGGNPWLKYSRKKEVGGGKYKCHYLLPSTRHCQMGIVVGREVHTPSKGDCYPSHYRVGPTVPKVFSPALSFQEILEIWAFFFFFFHVWNLPTQVFWIMCFFPVYWDIVTYSSV